MKNILIINGHDKFPYAEGKLNQTLTEEMAKILKTKYAVKESILQNGWDVQEETQKYQWADVIIYQMPIYWFAAPARLKKYMEDVYAYGVFYKGGASYGRGGMMTGKQYMLSSTWNAPADAFTDISGFFAGQTPDDVLVAMHKTQEFIGLTKLPSFSCHDVIKSPNIPAYLEALRIHLKKVFDV